MSRKSKFKGSIEDQLAKIELANEQKEKERQEKLKQEKMAKKKAEMANEEKELQAEEGATARPECSWQQFSDWCLAHGFIFNHPVQTKAVDGLRGLFTDAAIPDRTVVVAVPATMTINCAMIAKDKKFNFPCVPVQELEDTRRLGMSWFWWYMATYLAHLSLCSRSDWEPYINFLPRGGFVRQRQALAENLTEQLPVYRMFWTRVMGDVSPDVFEKEWLWAMMMIQSRNQPVLPEGVRHLYKDTPEADQVDDEVFLPTVIPVLDLANHSETPNCVVCGPIDHESHVLWNQELGLPADEYYFFLRTTREIAPGEELTVSYGTKSPKEFREIFDFVPSKE